MIVIVLVIGKMGNWIAYSSDEWKEANAYYKASAILKDYNGIPPYGEVRDILDKYGVTETEYEGFANWIMIGSSINADCLEELAEYVKNNHTADINLINLIRSSVDKLIEPSLACNNLVGLLWVCVLIWMFVAKRKDIFLPALGLWAARTVVWCYIIYKGRMPNSGERYL